MRNFFPQRHRTGFPREAEDAPSLQGLKARVGEATGNQIECVASPAMAGGLELNDL